jgi:hypothetical protein
VEEADWDLGSVVLACARNVEAAIARPEVVVAA